jgi:hypothetical protein
MLFAGWSGVEADLVQAEDRQLTAAEGHVHHGPAVGEGEEGSWYVVVVDRGDVQRVSLEDVAVRRAVRETAVHQAVVVRVDVPGHRGCHATVAGEASEPRSIRDLVLIRSRHPPVAVVVDQPRTNDGAQQVSRRDHAAVGLVASDHHGHRLDLSRVVGGPECESSDGVTAVLDRFHDTLAHVVGKHVSPVAVPVGENETDRVGDPDSRQESDRARRPYVRAVKVTRLVPDVDKRVDLHAGTGVGQGVHLGVRTVHHVMGTEHVPLLERVVDVAPIGAHTSGTPPPDPIVAEHDRIEAIGDTLHPVRAVHIRGAVRYHLPEVVALSGAGGNRRTRGVGGLRGVGFHDRGRVSGRPQRVAVAVAAACADRQRDESEHERAELELHLLPPTGCKGAEKCGDNRNGRLM